MFPYSDPHYSSIVFQLPDRALFWRSVLQVLLLRHKPDLKLEDQQVGRIAAKSKDFSDYVAKALEKLQLGIQVRLR